jgi:hypothetical protein
MRKQNEVFVTYVNVPTDRVGSRNTSFRGTGLKVTLNGNSRVVSDRPRGKALTN